MIYKKHLGLLLSLLSFLLSSQKAERKLLFHENLGQFCDQNYKQRKDVLFSGADDGTVFYLRNSGISYQFYKKDLQKTKTQSQKPLWPSEAAITIPTSTTTVYRLDVNWLNVNVDPIIEKSNPSEDYENFYLAQCPEGVLGVKSFSEVTYKKIYNGIDLKFYTANTHLKYDYIIQPYADYKQIKFQIKGQQRITINKSGFLIISTPFGELVEEAPVVKQEGKKLKARWKVNNDIVSFDIAGIDKTKELIIDPLVRFWGTYYGGIDSDGFWALEKDNNNNVYCFGNTSSATTTLIATTGSHQNTFAGNTDAMLVKFNSNGVRQWGTYYGGTGGEGAGIGKSCALDAQGNIFICGAASSSVGIATVGAHQPSLGGGAGDGFLAKFNSNGVRQWATYYGGAVNENLDACATDALGNVFVTGRTTTNSGTAIATPGSHQSSFGGGTDTDAFLVKFNNSGTRLWGTYYGGIGYDYGMSVATDLNGNVYMTGGTKTTTANIISTPGAYQASIGSLFVDGFIVKFDPSGVRSWGTYYGGSGNDVILGCTVDKSNNICLVGETDTPGGWVATSGCHQAVYGGNDDSFVARFTAEGARIWSTYYGGSSWEQTLGITTDNNRDVYICGTTDSPTSDTIASINSYQSFYGGAFDAFLARFDSSGVRKWGTYFGGDLNDGATKCIVDNQGYLYLAGGSRGYTTSIISTPGSHQYSPGSNVTYNDAFLVKFFDCATQISAAPQINEGCFGMNIASVSINPAGGTGYTYTWVPGGANTSSVINIAPGNYTCYINSVCGNTSQTLSIISPTSAVSASVSTSNNLICSGSSATLVVNSFGGMPPYYYLWNTNNTTSSITVTPSTNTSYTVIIKDKNGCAVTDTITQFVSPCTFIKENELGSAVDVFPNPATHSCVIHSSRCIENLKIFNSLGQVVVSVSDNTANSLTVNFDSFASGVYTLAIKIQNQVVYKKVIKS